jgi:hypothetical protein
VDPISPELALVDPELAAEARASLPDPVPFARPRPIERPVAIERPVPVRRRSGRSRRRQLVGFAALLAALILAAGLSAFILGQLRDEPQPAARSIEPPAAPATQAPPPPPPAQEPAPQAPRAARPQPAPAPTRRARSKPTPPPAASVLGARKDKPPAPPAARKAKPPAPPAAKKAAPPAAAHRVYIWAPAKGALYYRVEFFRNGKPFHAAQTADPSLRLPAALKLPPGTYRWSVRPATVGKTGVVLRGAILTRSFRVGRG